MPTRAPGLLATPIRTIGGELTFATYYENVRVPVANTVGPVNAGWGLITGQLNLERITLAMPASLDRLFEEVVALGVRDAARPAARASPTSRGCSRRSRASTRASRR